MNMSCVPPAIVPLAAYDCVTQNMNKSGFYDYCNDKCWTDVFIAEHDDIETEIYGKLFPILLIVMLVANFFVIIVLSKPQMANSATNIVLLHMAIAETFVGLTPFPYTFYSFTLGYQRDPMAVSMGSCLMFKYLMDALPPICHYVAMWLTVLLAAQRLLSVSYPLASRTWLQPSRVKYATLVVVIASVLAGIPKLIDNQVHALHTYAYVQIWENRTDDDGPWVPVHRCIHTMSPLVTYIGEDSYYSVYFWTRAVLFICVPCAMLLALQFGLVRAVRKAAQRRRRLVRERREREARRQMESNMTSIMLVVIVSIFLVVNLPQGIYVILMCVANTFQIHLPLLDWSKEFFLVDNMLIMATYPVNFAIYCFMSSQFRDTFYSIFCACRQRNSTHHTSVLLQSRRSDPYYENSVIEAARSQVMVNGKGDCSTNESMKSKVSSVNGAPNLHIYVNNDVEPLQTMTDNQDSPFKRQQQSSFSRISPKVSFRTHAIGSNNHLNCETLQDSDSELLDETLETEMINEISKTDTVILEPKLSAQCGLGIIEDTKVSNV